MPTFARRKRPYRMPLNLPPFDYRIRKHDGASEIYDAVRRKYVRLTPEEWVRQHFVHFLIEMKGYPTPLMAIEKGIGVYGMRRRFDIVCYDRQGNPFLIVECKAPEVPLSQATFDQVFGYNLTVAAPYVAITNGIVHLCGTAGDNRQFRLLPDIPAFPIP